MEARELVCRSLVCMVQWLQLDHKNLTSLSTQLRMAGQGEEPGRTARTLQLLIAMERDARAKLDNENQGQHDLIHSLTLSQRNLLLCPPCPDVTLDVARM